MATGRTMYTVVPLGLPGPKWNLRLDWIRGDAVVVQCEFRGLGWVPAYYLNIVWLWPQNLRTHPFPLVTIWKYDATCPMGLL